MRDDVRYAVYPETVVLRDHSIRQIGFRLELYGGVGSDSRVRPGDSRCRETFIALRDIASRIVPASNGDCHCVVSGSPAALHFDGGAQGDRGWVQLDITILHGDGGERPVEAMEARALHETEKRLEDLGVTRGRSH